MKIAAALVLATALSAAALAQDDMFIPKPPPPDLGIRGEFMRDGNGFVCNISANSPVKPQGELPSKDQPCLYIGPDPQHAFAIGSEAIALMQRLGQPAQTHSDINGTTSYVYPLAPGEDPPFMMVTVSHDRIGALQVSGRGSKELDILMFNRIKLGDNSSVVKELLGAPFKVIPSAEAGAELWSYLPWTFQFEITDAKVTTIRLTSTGVR